MGGSLIEVLGYVNVENEDLTWWQLLIALPLSAGVLWGLMLLLSKFTGTGDEQHDPPPQDPPQQD